MNDNQVEIMTQTSKLNIKARLFILSASNGTIKKIISVRINRVELNTISLTGINPENLNVPMTGYQLALMIDEVGPLEKIHMLCSVNNVIKGDNHCLELKIDQIPEKHMVKLNGFKNGIMQLINAR